MNLTNKLSASFAGLSLTIILLLSFLSYDFLKESTLQRLNEQLLTAANATDHIVGQQAHNQLENASPANYDTVSRRLADFIQASGLDWAYATVKRGNRVYYTYINQTQEELQSGRYQNWYLEEYKVVPKMLHAAFDTHQIQFEDYQGEYGRYRSIFLPFYNQQGELYVIGVDISLSDVDQMLNNALKQTAVVALLVLIAALIAARFIAVPIVSPINALYAVLVDIANGNWDLTRRVSVTTRDEIGKMSEAFNTFMAALRERMLEVNQSTESVAAITAQLDPLVSAITQRSIAQADNVGNSATAIEELATSSQSISTVVGHANQQMLNFELHTDTTVAAINEAVIGMQRVQRETNELADKLRQLDGRAVEINSILEVIKGIADQTNLLALNAAIEAARAGAQGRGFAVVADEVRQLSERTAKATIEISKMINAIQHDTSGATETMQSAVVQVDNCVQHAAQANTTLGGFRSEITQITHGMDEITESVREQACAAEHLSANVADLSSSADDNRTSTEEAKQGVEELKRRSCSLRDVVQLFRF
ncbi:methyl-accepting chemotaxis protein [Photobacterium sp. MCCC 1A19761]|uniref:methyl-accepting chemotaxis protein n=1 Tax=Photobacterium sp. MCCC 1A19761 TaxID=3115000 RepID=UPI00307ED276